MTDDAKIDAFLSKRSFKKRRLEQKEQRRLEGNSQSQNYNVTDGRDHLSLLGQRPSASDTFQCQESSSLANCLPRGAHVSNTHDIKTKMMQSLANNNEDDSDDGDFVVREACMLWEKKNKEEALPKEKLTGTRQSESDSDSDVDPYKAAVEIEKRNKKISEQVGEEVNKMSRISKKNDQPHHGSSSDDDKDNKIRHRRSRTSQSLQAFKENEAVTETNALQSCSKSRIYQGSYHLDDTEGNTRQERAVKNSDAGKYQNNTIESGDDLWDDGSKTDLIESDSEPMVKKSVMRSKASNLRDKRKEKSFSQDSDLATLIMDDEDLEQLKPEIENPKLGPPGPLVPLELTEDTETKRDVPFSVPASINRYLQEYQREGVQFLFSRLAAGMGAILGDDMGMGKTIQTIALLAALLKKTGTGRDKRDIILRKSHFQKMDCQRHHANARALLEGTTISQTYSSETISPWAPVLIICPPGLISNWINEFNCWGYFDLEVWEKDTEVTLNKMLSGKCEILLCGKERFFRPENFLRISKVTFKVVIVDEYHTCKGRKTKIRESLQNLKRSSSCQIIGLTGTSMQNDYNELFFLVDLCQPKLLVSLSEFKRYYTEPLKLLRTKDAKQDVIELGQQRQEELRSALGGVILRRTKENYLKNCLKNKDERVVFCPLSEIQKEIYRHILMLPDYFVLTTALIPCDCGVNRWFFSKYKSLEADGRHAQIQYYRRHKDKIFARKNCHYCAPWDEDGAPNIHPLAVLWRSQHRDGELCGTDKAPMKCPNCLLFPALNKLYKLSSHPCLLQVEKRLENCDNPKEQEDIKAELEFAKVALTPAVLEMLPGNSYYRKDCIMNEHTRLSGKMNVLADCLKMFKVNDRVLIFSSWTTTLTLIEHYVKSMGYSYLRLDGSTPTKQRQVLVDKFQNDNTIFLFLISTKAGGLGLNLTAANKVIIYDVSWNPSNDAQAQDRSYRPGQKQDVDVIRLVSQGCIEELIYARQIYKLHLKQQIEEEEVGPARIFRAVQDDKSRKGELFGLQNLLRFKDGSFIAEMWKQKTSAKVDIHDEAEIARALCNCSEGEVDNLADRGEDEDAFIQRELHKNIDVDNDIPQVVVRHGAFMREDEGRAILNVGDKGFDEEVGGGSQLAALACDLLCQQILVDGTEMTTESVPTATLEKCENHAKKDTKSEEPILTKDSSSCSMSVNNNLAIDLQYDTSAYRIGEKKMLDLNASSPKKGLQASLTLMGKKLVNETANVPLYIPSYVRKKRRDE